MASGWSKRCAAELKVKKSGGYRIDPLAPGDKVGQKAREMNPETDLNMYEIPAGQSQINTGRFGKNVIG